MNFEDIKYKTNLEFLNLKNISNLATLLNTNASALVFEIDNAKYSQFTINKKSGGLRTILTPETKIKLYQKKLNTQLQNVYYQIKPSCCHGFIKSILNNKSYGIVSNAQPHIGNKYVMNLDLENYFLNIKTNSIKKLFEGSIFNFPEKLASALALLFTYQGSLPVGAPTSPVLSNFITLKLDKELSAFCNLNNIIFTRYADDLTFSGNEYFNLKIIKEIENIILSNNFKINKNKFRIKNAQSKQKVTGIVVNEKLNLDRKYLKEVRAMLHNFKLNGLQKAGEIHYIKNNKKLKYQENSSFNSLSFKYQLKGRIDFIGMVRGKDDKIYKKYKDQFISLAAI